MSEFDEWMGKECSVIQSAYGEEYIAAQEAWDFQQSKIDELQERVDEAMRLLQTRQHNPDVTNIIFEMHKILKGNKDEAGLN